MRKYFYLGFIIILALSLSFINLSALTIREQRTGDLIWIKRMESNTFSMQWMHSVELEQWRETYQFTENGSIQLLESRFKAFGAGVPDNEGKEFYLEDEWFVMKGIEREFQVLPVGVSCYSNHRLIIQQEEYPLCDWVADGSYVDIKEEKVPLYSYSMILLMKEDFSWSK